LYAATPPYQSYILVAKVRRPPDDALFWDNSDPYYYVRRVGEDHESLILVGGCDHRTGAGDSVKATKCLEDWTHQRFEVESIVQRWSAEFFEPTEGLPMIGLGPGKKNIWVATGLSGVGLTLGTAAATLIANGIEGKKITLEDAFSPNRMALSKDWVMEQATATANLVERVWPASSVSTKDLDDGEGHVGKVDGQQLAVCRDLTGCIHKFDPICPHIGGVLHWNQAEQTWDCPLHGGRFTADGERLYGPPEADLKSIP
jgi:Rieske Fe-S protein